MASAERLSARNNGARDFVGGKAPSECASSCGPRRWRWRSPSQKQRFHQAGRPNGLFILLAKKDCGQRTLACRLGAACCAQRRGEKARTAASRTALKPKLFRAFLFPVQPVPIFASWGRVCGMRCGRQYLAPGLDVDGLVCGCAWANRGLTAGRAPDPTSGGGGAPQHRATMIGCRVIAAVNRRDMHTKEAETSRGALRIAGRSLARRYRGGR